MRTFKLVVAALALANSFGCAYKIRSVTAEVWEAKGQGLYVGYWEGTCKAVLGCDAGDGKVTWCVLNPDNSLSCTEQQAVNKVLGRKERKQ